MNFRDQKLTCSVCEEPFIFTVTEQRRIAEAHKRSEGVEPDAITPPEKCPNCRLRDPDTGRYTGRIKWFNYEKGYGFIVKPNADEIFFHRSQVVDGDAAELEEGMPVSFEQVETEKGMEAQEVKVTSGS